MTMMVISYVSTWISIIYSLVTAPSDIELWGKEMEQLLYLKNKAGEYKFSGFFVFLLQIIIR